MLTDEYRTAIARAAKQYTEYTEAVRCREGQAGQKAEKMREKIREMLRACSCKEVCDLLAAADQSIILFVFPEADDNIMQLCVTSNGLQHYTLYLIDAPCSAHSVLVDTAAIELFDLGIDPQELEVEFFKKIQVIIDATPKISE